jgi:phosphatidylinositol glycan class N
MLHQVQSYYHRQIYTICYVLIAAWPLLYGAQFCRENAALCATWALGSASMSIFTLLPANKIESLNLM